jgi:hypothetical protein
LRLVRRGADRRASDHYRFDAEQKRRARLSWLPSLLKLGRDASARADARFAGGSNSGACLLKVGGLGVSQTSAMDSRGQECRCCRPRAEDLPVATCGCRIVVDPAPALECTRYSARALRSVPVARQDWGDGLPDDPDRPFHAELSLLATVLGAQDAGEDVYARPLVDQLPAGDPLLTFVLYMCAYARDVHTGELPGPYTDHDARRFARAALVPEELGLPA